MKKITDNPELQNAITAVLQDPTTIIITEISSLNKEHVTLWLNACINFIKKNARDLGSISYIIELSTTGANTTQLSANIVIDKLKAGFNVFIVDHLLKLIGYENIPTISGSFLSQYSRRRGSVILHVINGVDFIIYANGVTIREMNTTRLTMLPPAYKKTMRSGYDYELSIQEHYKQRIRFSQYCNHWFDKGKRILVGNRKTEEVFQENLLNWLCENLSDSKVVGKVNKLSKDETDIEIQHILGDCFLLEIKWLGVNSSGTEYKIKKIENGISQIKNYLLRDTDVFEAALIVYDGRSLDDFKSIAHDDEEPEQWKKISKCGGKKLPARGKAYVFFLESEDASRRKQC